MRPHARVGRTKSRRGALAPACRAARASIGLAFLPSFVSMLGNVKPLLGRFRLPVVGVNLSSRVLAARPCHTLCALTGTRTSNLSPNQYGLANCLLRCFVVLWQEWHDARAISHEEPFS